MEKGKHRLLDGGTLRAAAVSFGTYLLLLALAAYLTLNGRVGEEHTQGAVRACAAAAAFVGAVLSARRGTAAVLLGAALFCGTVLLLGALSGSGLDAESALLFLPSAAVGTLPALLLRRHGRKRGRRRAPKRRST